MDRLACVDVVRPELKRGLCQVAQPTRIDLGVVVEEDKEFPTGGRGSPVDGREAIVTV